MPKQAQLDRINARGWNSSYLLAPLQRKATISGRTMAAIFTDSIKGAWAFNVPALAIKYNSNWTYYQFSDGSKIRCTNEGIYCEVVL